MKKRAFSPEALVTALLAALLLTWPSLPAAQSPDDTRRRADDHVMQGIEQFRQGRHEETFRSWQEAVRLYRSIGDRPREGRVLENLGAAALRLDRAAEARDYLARSADIARETGDRDAERHRREKLGHAQRALEAYPEAIEAYQAALAGARAAGDARSERVVLGSLGISLRAVQQHDAALEHLRRVLALARQAGDDADAGAALWHIGHIGREIEDYSRAVDAFSQASGIARQLGDRGKEAAALTELGTTYYLLGDFARAVDVLEQALALARASGDRRAQAQALRTLGSVQYIRGDARAAVDHYEKDLELRRQLGDRKNEGLALGNLGLAHTKLGDYGKAVAFHQQDLAINRGTGDRLAESQTLGNLGVVYTQIGDYPRAIQHYRESLVVARAIGYRRGEGIALTNLGLAYFTAGRLAEAEQALRDALAVQDALREHGAAIDPHQVSLFETHLRTYRHLQATLVARGQPELALEIAERGRARALVQLMSRRRSPTGASDAAVPPATLAELRDAARRRNATLVEYAAVPEESALYIWVVQPSGTVVFRRADLDTLSKSGVSLDDLVDRVRLSLGVGARGGSAPGGPGRLYERALEDLHRVLVEPIVKDLPTDPQATVIIAPQGSLFMVPFAALRDGSGRLLIERHTLVVVPSIQTLELARSQRARPGGPGRDALVVGNPTMPRLSVRPGAAPEPLPPLPHAEREARDVARLLGTQPLTGDQASKPVVVQRMRRARLVHLATHGVLDDLKQLGVPGAIALAPSAGDDGLLTAGEIMDLDLRAELVVLSACDTGRGRITGDAVVGLSRSLISAGAPSVLVSLWSVPDLSTAELMAAFYGHWQRDGHAARSLRRAMLDVKARRPHPRDWAGFVLIGETEAATTP